MLESKITKNGQTTIPKAVRERLELQAGSRIRYLVTDDGVIIRPVVPLDQLFGVLDYDGPPVTIEDMNEAIAKGACGD